MSIRDTSAQDQVVSRPSGLRRVPKAWLVGGGAGLAVLALALRALMRPGPAAPPDDPAPKPDGHAPTEGGRNA